MSADNQHAAIDAAIAALGIEYKAEFVPQRLSRTLSGSADTFRFAGSYQSQE